MSATASNVKDKNGMPTWAIVLLTTTFSVLITLGFTEGVFRNIWDWFWGFEFNITVPLWLVMVAVFAFILVMMRSNKKPDNNLEAAR